MLNDPFKYFDPWQGEVIPRWYQCHITLDRVHKKALDKLYGLSRNDVEVIAQSIKGALERNDIPASYLIAYSVTSNRLETRSWPAGLKSLSDAQVLAVGVLVLLGEAASKSKVIHRWAHDGKACTEISYDNATEDEQQWVRASIADNWMQAVDLLRIVDLLEANNEFATAKIKIDYQSCLSTNESL